MSKVVGINANWPPRESSSKWFWSFHRHPILLQGSVPRFSVSWRLKQIDQRSVDFPNEKKKDGIHGDVRSQVGEKRCLHCLLAEKALANLNEEDTGDQGLLIRLERTRRWRGAVVHIVRLCFVLMLLARCVRPTIKYVWDCTRELLAAEPDCRQGVLKDDKCQWVGPEPLYGHLFYYILTVHKPPTLLYWSFTIATRAISLNSDPLSTCIIFAYRHLVHVIVEANSRKQLGKYGDSVAGDHEVRDEEEHRRVRVRLSYHPLYPILCRSPCN